MESTEQDNKLLAGLCLLYSESETYFQSNNDLLASLKSLKAPYSNKTFLDEGGMKNIYTCKDLRSDRIIALAEINDVLDNQKLNDFLREAKITAYLQHPNIIPVYEIGLNETGIPFFTMKLIRGQNFGSIIRKLKNKELKTIKEFPLPKLVDIFEKICDGIAYAHSKGILHLDLKPDNISVSSFGEVLICDWGISEICPEAFEGENINNEEFKSLLPLMRSDNVIRGTIPFISPEQVNKEMASVSPLSDIYSLGVILYSILTHDTPFKHTQQKDEFIAVLKGDFVTPSKKRPAAEIPKSLEAICMKAMQFKPADRYQSVNEILTELQRYQHGYATKAEEATAFELLSLLYKRNRIACISIAVAALVVLLTVSVSVNGIKKSERVAIQEKNKALIAKNKTMELITQLKSEQVQKLSLSSKAAEKYLQNVRNMLYFKNYKKADETIEAVWELGSHENKYRKFYGWYKVALLNFGEAIQILTPIINDKENIKILQVAQMTLSVDTVKQIANLIDKNLKDRNLAGYFLRNCINENFTLKEQMEILKFELTKNTSSKINFKYEHLETGIKLDISGTQVTYPGSLDKFNIINLNISNTFISRPEVIRWPSIESLNAGSSKLKALGSAPQLRWLDVSNCEIKDFAKIKEMKNLEYLNIQGLKKFPINSLYKLPKLKILVIDKNQLISRKGTFEVRYK